MESSGGGFNNKDLNDHLNPDNDKVYIHSLQKLKVFITPTNEDRKELFTLLTRIAALKRDEGVEHVTVRHTINFLQKHDLLEAKGFCLKLNNLIRTDQERYGSYLLRTGNIDLGLNINPRSGFMVKLRDSIRRE
jgi:hypothetical protein